MEKINVFIVALPTFDSVVEKIKDAIEDAFEEPKKFIGQKGFGRKFETPKRCNEDLTPPKFRINKSCNGVEPWGVFGEPADENKRFGFKGPEIDEPRASDYDCRWEFEDDHEAFDNYVSAAEDCIARGLEKKNDAPIHRCEAIRQPVGCVPPMGVNLIGETDWWSNID
jgi:hypothetical protein